MENGVKYGKNLPSRNASPIGRNALFSSVFRGFGPFEDTELSIRRLPSQSLSSFVQFIFVRSVSRQIFPMNYHPREAADLSPIAVRENDERLDWLLPHRRRSFMFVLLSN